MSRIGQSAAWAGKWIGDWMLGRGLGSARFSSDITGEERRIITAARPYTMTSLRRLECLVKATGYVHKNGIRGAIVECGVWKGGSIIAAARTMENLGEHGRAFWLYDTFQGMPSPSERHDGIEERSLFEKLRDESGHSNWCLCSEEEVRANIAAQTSLPLEQFHFVKGKVEETLLEAGNVPREIALLRLDTDWYESTKAELEVLFPRVARNGVVILDDYAHWSGSQKAADEYFAARGIAPLLFAVDQGCRVFIKTD